MLVRTIRRLLLEAQALVPRCVCVAAVDVPSGLLLGITDVEFSAELRELMAATTAHWMEHSPAQRMDRALSNDQSQVQLFVASSGRSVHIMTRNAATPELAVVFTAIDTGELHDLCERARRATALFDAVL